MKRFHLAAALALLTTPVFAQDTQALAEKYVNLPGVQQMITNMFSAENMANQIAAGLPANITLTDDQKQRIGQLMSGAMNDLRPMMETLLTNASAQTLSVPELQALIDFYSSEHGSAVMSKMQPMMAALMAKMAPEMKTMQAKITPQLIEILREQN